MRATFANALTRYVDEGRDLVLLTADLGFSVLDEFKQRHPTRIVNMGVAESAMVGVAAGLALAGERPIVYSISKFLANKCFEEIREDVCLHRLPVLLVGVGAGLAYGHAGYTHFSTQDIAVLRTIPELTILSPIDPHEMIMLLDEALATERPVYLRLGKSGEPTISHRSSLAVGEAYTLADGSDIALVCHGAIASEVLAAAERLRDVLGIDPTVVSSPTVKPVDRSFFETLRSSHDLLYVVEEHSEIGGLGDALANFGVRKIAVPDRLHLQSGDTAYLRTQAGIDAAGIANRVATDVVGRLG